MVQVHPVLPASEARDLADYLKRGCEKSGTQHIYSEFRGGHEIPLQVFQEVTQFLDEVFHVD